MSSIFYMGVIRPPWISKEFFSKCPFNYCDHFGNKEILALICKICVHEVDRKTLLRNKDRDLLEMKYVDHDIAKDLAKTLVLVNEEAEAMGINLSNYTAEVFKNIYLSHNNTLLAKIDRYGQWIEKAIQVLDSVLSEENKFLIIKAIDALSHSRHYIYVKTRRAYSSKQEEEEQYDYDLQDSKTSAFYAYIAAERNSRVFLTLSLYKPLQVLKKRHTQLTRLSIEIGLLIREEFFSNEGTKYVEFGYDEFRSF